MTESNASSARHPGIKNPRRWWPYLLLAPVGLLITFVLIIIILLRTDYGLNRLETLLNNTLADVGGQQVALSGLHGRFPFDLRLRELRLADAEGAWLEIDEVVLRWSGRDLLAARVRIHELSVDRAELFRIPASDEPKPTSEPVKPESWEALLDFEPPTAFPRMALDNLDIRRIILAQAVAGDRIVLRLHGDLDAGEHGARMNLSVDSLAGPADEAGLLSLRAGFVPETDLLDLRLAFTDPGGSLVPLLGLPPATPLEVTLEGDGPPLAWDGVFSVQAGELFSLQSNLGLAWPDHPSLTWHGEFTLAPSLLPDPAQALLPPTTFQVQASMPRPDSVHLAGFTLRNALLDLHVDAEVNLDHSTLRGGLRLDVLDTAPLAELAGVELGPRIGLRGDVSGPLTSPDIQLALHLADIFADPVRVGGLDLDAAIRFSDPGETPDARVISVAGTMTTQGLYVPDTALPPDLTANFDAAYRLADNFLDVTSLNLLGQGVDIHVAGGYGLDTNRLDAHLELRPSPIQPWLAPYGLEDVAGEADLRATAQGTVQPLRLDVDLDAGLTHLAGLPDPLPQLLGAAPRLRGQVRLVPPKDDSATGQGPGIIQARDVRLQAPGLGLSAEADFTPATGELSAQAALTLPDLSLASPNPDPDPGLGLAGAAVLNIQAQGDVSQNLVLHLDLHSDDLRIADLEAFPLQLLATIHSLPAAPRGELTLSASPLQAPLLLETAFALDDSLLRLSELELIVPEGALHGQGVVDLDSQLVTARLQGRIRDIAPLSALAGQSLHGALDLDVELQPDVTPDNQSDDQSDDQSDEQPNGPAPGTQNVRLSAGLINFQADFGTLAELNLNGRIQDALSAQDGPKLHLDVAVKDFQAGETSVNSLDATITGSLADLVLNATTRGHALHPFTLRLEAAYADRDGSHSVELRDLTGDWAEQPLLLTAPVHITLGEQEQTVSPLHLEFGPAIVRGDARIGPEDADLRLGIESLPLSLFTPDILGTVTAGAVLQGPTSALRGDLTVLGESLQPTGTNLENVPSLAIQADAALDGTAITLTAVLRENDTTTPLLQAQGHVPLTLGLTPAGLDLPSDAPMRATIQGDLDLGWLGKIFLTDSQLLAGTLKLDFQLSGTLDAPQPAGSILIRQGSYQHLLQGVLLQDIEADAQVTDKRFELTSLSATDGGQGRLHVTGGVDLDPGQSFPFLFSVQMTSMNILDSPMVQARLANVDLAVSGSTATQEVKGEVVLDRVEIFLKDLGGPQVVDLPVVETNKHHAASAEPVTPPTPAPPLVLDLEVRFPARVFVRGRGLDSEWGGNLRITGTAAQPVIRGEIRPQRGRLDLLGKRFTVAPESVIQFTGGQPPLPFVNLTAYQTRRDPDGEKTFTVHISGVPPDIPPPTLTSDPPLPQDEILSQMLFGRSLSRISATQAAQLALAARELAGHGSGLNLMGTARDLLQLDDLDLISGQAEDMTLRAGKYIHNRVYLRLDSDLKTGEETASVDVELTPRINLESTLGPKGGGLGLFWKRDY
ncbi:translocation/assembly module TamB domain-containing protein [Desulfonatronum lacustre]|uniref:translocation/assembly module TamB domain-containing protein n=1 Tax=Desulfonatronum lacustre TaxID=66849 RepID=UPI0004BA1B4D|nr:translocation/assembly module TamB domain-containing protein [Desulfonatronum lacustre]